MVKNKIKEEMGKTSVLTVRISQELDQILEIIRKKKGISKALLIRNYLEMAKYILLDQESIKSLDDRDLILIKRKTFQNILKGFPEEEQIRFGVKFAEFINDLARIQGKIDEIQFKLDLCEHLGFFPKFIDNENYILFSNRFGPKKFIEAFAYKLVNHESEKVFNAEFTEEGIESKKATKQEYHKTINPVIRASSYYAFEFAKIEEKK